MTLLCPAIFIIVNAWSPPRPAGSAWYAVREVQDKLFGKAIEPLSLYGGSSNLRVEMVQGGHKLGASAESPGNTHREKFSRSRLVSSMTRTGAVKGIVRLAFLDLPLLTWR